MYIQCYPLLYECVPAGPHAESHRGQALRVRPLRQELRRQADGHNHLYKRFRLILQYPKKSLIKIFYLDNIFAVFYTAKKKLLKYLCQ